MWAFQREDGGANPYRCSREAVSEPQTEPGKPEVGSDGGFTVKRSMVSERSCTNRVQSILNLGGNTDIMFALNRPGGRFGAFSLCARTQNTPWGIAGEVIG